MQSRWFEMLNDERGKAESKAPTIVALVILGVLVFLSLKFIPVYYTNMKFEQAINEIMNWDRFYEGDKVPTVQGTRQKVLKAARDMSIPLRDEDLDVSRTEDRRIYVKLKYTRIVTLPLVESYRWTFEIYKLQDV